MKYRYVGDIHGQIDVMKLALDCEADRIIFCGDLVDSWRTSVKDQVACLELALDSIGTGRVDVLWGNHEWSYIDERMRCSGYKFNMDAQFLPLKEQILKKFKPFVYEEGILVTHAGLTNQLWEKYKLTLDIFEQVLIDWSQNTNSPFFDIGHARGGRAKFGGPLWCDFNHEFVPIPELTQVFGHTRGNGIRTRDNAYCIDTLENTSPQFLDMEFFDEAE